MELGKWFIAFKRKHNLITMRISKRRRRTRRRGRRRRRGRKRRKALVYLQVYQKAGLL